MVVDTTTPLHANDMRSVGHAPSTSTTTMMRRAPPSYLEKEFHGLQHGSMTVTDYYRKQKVLADELNALGMTIIDQKASSLSQTSRKNMKFEA
jgi:hypothetical protein